MTYIIKRKFQGLLGDDVDNSQIAAFTQHIVINPPPITTQVNYDSLTVNHLVVQQTMKIPVGTDKYK